jgi:hypothetical protein
MSEAIGRPGGAAEPHAMDIGGILSTALQLYRRHWPTLWAVAAVVVVPLTLLQYLFGDWIRTREGTPSNPMMSPWSWRRRPPRWSRCWPGC